VSLDGCAESRAAFGLGDALRPADGFALRLPFPSTVNGRLNGIFWVWAHDWCITSEDQQSAGFGSGIDEFSKGQDAVETVGHFAIEHFNIGEQVAGLHARDDVEIVKAGDVCLIDELGVLDSEPGFWQCGSSFDWFGTASFVFRGIEHTPNGGIADGVHGQSEA